MCSGRIDLAFVLRAFANGQDGVFIGGCRLDECNYTTHGNYHALNMVLLGKKILEYFGLNPARLRVEFMSSGEGLRFTKTIDDFTTTIKTLGPLAHAAGEGANPDELKSKLAEIQQLVPYIKIVLKEKLAQRIKDEERYNDFLTLDEIEQLFQQTASYYIDPEKCRACSICSQRCPVEAVSGGKKLIHVIDQDKCIKCGTCLDVCPERFGAVRKYSGEPVPPAIAEEDRIIDRSGRP